MIPTLLDHANAAITVLAVQDPGSVAPPGSGNITMAAGWAKWVAGIGVLIGVFVLGATMAVSHRSGRGGEHGSAFGYILGGAILVGSGAALVTQLGV